MTRLPAACLALAAAMAAVPASARGQQTDSTAGTGLPAGQGTVPLSQIQLQLQSSNLVIVFVPLDESVIRLLAPDSYRSLHALEKSYQKQIDSIAFYNGVQHPGLALVSFTGLQPNTQFTPDLLTVSVRGQADRPVGVVAMSPSFSDRVLAVHQQVTAIFVFGRPLPVRESFTVSYLDGNSDDWQSRLSRLDDERTRILGRMHAAAADTGGH